MDKLKVPKKLMEELIAEIIIEEGDYADPVTLKEGDAARKLSPEEMAPMSSEKNDGGGKIVPFEREVQQQASESENAPISEREKLALKAGAIKDGIETWFRGFKVDRDTIQLRHGNKATVMSKGSGESYYIMFRVNSWNPPAVEIQEMKKIDVGDMADDLPQDL